MIFLGVGSSIGDAAATFDSAERMLAEHGVPVIRKSSLHKTPPYGSVAHNEFTNAVWEIKLPPFKKGGTKGGSLTPTQLLTILHHIESAHGRTRDQKWADRTLDLDILIWDDLIMNEPDLTIPHPDLANRLFVLEPLAELVDETFEIPTVGTLGSLRANLSRSS